MQDKLEELHSQNSHLEIFEHASLMTLDTIMKCAFSYQGNHQADRSVKCIATASYFLPTGVDSSGGSSSSWDVYQPKEPHSAESPSQIQPTPNLH